MSSLARYLPDLRPVADVPGCPAAAGQCLSVVSSFSSVFFSGPSTVTFRVRRSEQPVRLEDRMANRAIERAVNFRTSGSPSGVRQLRACRTAAAERTLGTVRRQAAGRQGNVWFPPGTRKRGRGSKMGTILLCGAASHADTISPDCLMCTIARSVELPATRQLSQSICTAPECGWNASGLGFASHSFCRRSSGRRPASGTRWLLCSGA